MMMNKIILVLVTCSILWGCDGLVKEAEFCFDDNSFTLLADKQHILRSLDGDLVDYGLLCKSNLTACHVKLLEDIDINARLLDLKRRLEAIDYRLSYPLSTRLVCSNSRMIIYDE